MLRRRLTRPQLLGGFPLVANTKSHLGVGLYTLPEAARLVRAHPQSLGRWLFGAKNGGPVLTPRFGGKDRIVTFIDIVQALAIRSARLRPRRVPLPKIREAIENAKADYGLEAPLAYRHTLYCFDGGIVVRLARRHLVGLTGKDRRQALMPQIVEPFLDEIDWGRADGLARTWTPLRSGPYSIVLDPRTRFGQPTVEPTGLLADALADAVDAEGSLQRAASAHEVPAEAVLLALKYRDALAGIVS